MEFDVLHGGALYLPTDDALAAAQTQCLEKLYDYNATRPGEAEKRERLLRGMFCEIGEGCYIEPPLHANWGGRHCRFGRFVYANFGLTLVDDTYITVGDYTLFGPNVVLATAGHPVHPALRRAAYQHNQPIVIGRNCWLGAGVIVLPGVTIGDNSVVGAGSVVTKDIPPNAVAAGNPCRVLRFIAERDLTFYYKDRRIPERLLAEVGEESDD